jgi:branched-chain amino acid transport system substrate-binding protein
MIKKITALLLVTIMALGLVSCAATASETDTAAQAGTTAASTAIESAAAASGAEIKIGLYGTITGTNALAGEMMEKGGQLAVKEINDAGGINGRPLKLIVYDDKSSPEGAVKAVTRLVDVDKVIAMVGSNSSPNILASVQITEDAHIIQVGGGTSPAYTNAGYKYLFRGTANGKLPNKACVDAMKTMEAKTVGILSVATEYGKSTVDSFKTLLGSDIEVVAEEVYQSTDTDYTGQVAKILNANPDAVLIIGMTSELALAVKQFRRSGYEGYIYGPEAMGVPDLLNVAGSSADNVIFGSGAVVPASVEGASNEVERKMLEHFVAEYGSLPVSDVAYRGYDGVKLIAEALRNAENPDDSEAVRNAFVKINGYPSIAGTYNFTDESGDGLSEARSYIIQGGKHVLFADWFQSK